MKRVAGLSIYCVLVVITVTSLHRSGDLSLGRHPWTNFLSTVSDFRHPSFLSILDQQTKKRAPGQRDPTREERDWLKGLARAAWSTVAIGTLGSLLAAILGAAAAALSSRRFGAAWPLGMLVRLMLSVLRAVPTLVWGILLVGIVGLGATAGVLAIALHSTGTYGKLFGEALDRLDSQQIEAGVALGLSPRQTIFHCLRGYVIRDWSATHLYLWEYAIRDSFVLGLVGAGGIGLLISEAVALFQWDRLATLLLVVVAVVWLFESLSAVARTNNSVSVVIPNRRDRSRRNP